MQKEQGGECVVSSVPHAGRHSFSKPTFDEAPTYAGIQKTSSVNLLQAVKKYQCVKLPLKQLRDAVWAAKALGPRMFTNQKTEHA